MRKLVKILLALILLLSLALAGLILVPVVSIFTPKPDAALIDDVFSCYDRKVLVSVKDSIGESAEA